jgi:TetR/AcrR family transcriptional repressor of nem operon
MQEVAIPSAAKAPTVARPREFEESAVLDAAMHLFWRSGYAATSVADLCKATGLGAGSLYAAYGDKRGLFIAALRRYAERVSARAIAALENGGPNAIAEYFAALIDAMVDGRRRAGCLLTNTLVEQFASDRTVSALIAGHLERLEAAFRVALMRRGVPRAQASRSAASLVCFVQGLNVIAKARPGRERLTELSAEALRSFVGPSARALAATARP